MLKNGRDLLDYGTGKPGVSHKWFKNRVDSMNDFCMRIVIE